MRDIQDFLHRNFDEVISYKGGEDLRVNCPFCATRATSEDTKQHLYVSLIKETCHCFRCEYSKSWIGLVMDVTGMDFSHSLGEIYETPNPADFSDLKEVLMERKFFKEKVTNFLPEDFKFLDKPWRSPLQSAAATYMKDRGFSLSKCLDNDLGVSESVGYRVIIPIEDGYWQARAIFPFLKPKYVNPETESRHVLFNADAIYNYKEVVICEGAFSAMAVGPNAVALIGKTVTKEKVERLKISKVEHFIITIEDGAGRTMVTLADALKGYGKQVTVWQYEHGDPADSDEFTEKPYDLKTKLKILMGETLKN